MDRRALSAYVPTDRLVALAEGHDLAPACTGAALFADIAGFTRLTNDLAAALGPRRGAQELTRHLNVAYDALIGKVHRYRGSVVDFSGDAVTCWFDDDGVPSRGARRATTAALAMHHALAELDELRLPAVEPVRLSLKVAVSSGTARRFTVGDPDIRCIDVLVGAAVERTASAEQLASHGQVMLDEATANHLGSSIDIASWCTHPDGDRFALLGSMYRRQEPEPWPPVEHIPVDAVAWVDRRLRRRDEEESTELRAAVALFVRLTGLDRPLHDGPDAGALDAGALDRAIRRAQAVLERYDGNLVQVTMGDKGGYLYVAFGAPVTHDDVTDRAVAAALALRDEPTGEGDVGFGGMGLAQGIARVGAYGATSRRTYGVLGDATNLAARLMSAAASDEILVSDHVRGAVRAPLLFDDPIALTVKGHAAPLPVSRLRGRPVGGGVRRFGELIGRGDELDALDAVLASVVDGPAGTVLVEGEPGVGKSHLIDVSRRRLTEHHDVTWLAAGVDDATERSLGAFVPLLRDLFYQELADDDASRRALLDHVVDARVGELREAGPGWAPLAEVLHNSRSYLAGLLGVFEAGSPYDRHDPSTRMERCIQAVRDYLRSETLARPVVVHVRDEHEIDDDSRRLAEVLIDAADASRLCVLLDRRPGLSPLDVKPDRILRLGPLDERGVASLVAALTGWPPAASWCRELHRRTGGNTLFVEQLVLDLHRRGRLELDEASSWELVGADEEIPLTLNAALVSRIDHLDLRLRRAVQAASVLGEAFSPEALAAMPGVATLEGGLDEAVVHAGVDAGVWSEGDDGRVRFRHALVREAAYGMQIDDQLRVLHRHAARAVARVGGVAASAAVADHLRLAGAPRRAASCYRRAARRARSRSQLRDAGDHYRFALHQASAAGCRVGALVALADEAADAAAARGDHVTAVALLSEVLALAADAPVHRRDPVRWSTRRGESRLRLGDLDGARHDLETALIALQDAPDLAVAGRIYLGLAMVHARSGELDDAFELATMALGFAADDDGETKAHHHLALIACHRGNHTDALAHAALALERAERSGDRRALAAIRNCEGLALAARGDLDSAEVAFAAAITDFETTGNEHGLAGALDNLAQLLADRGRSEEAIEHLERAVEILSRIGMGPDGVMTAMWKAGTW